MIVGWSVFVTVLRRLGRFCPVALGCGSLCGRGLIRCWFGGDCICKRNYSALEIAEGSLPALQCALLDLMLDGEVEELSSGIYVKKVSM